MSLWELKFATFWNIVFPHCIPQYHTHHAAVLQVQCAYVVLLYGQISNWFLDLVTTTIHTTLLHTFTSFNSTQNLLDATPQFGLNGLMMIGKPGILDARLINHFGFKIRECKIYTLYLPTSINYQIWGPLKVWIFFLKSHLFQNR